MLRRTSSRWVTTSKPLTRAAPERGLGQRAEHVDRRALAGAVGADNYFPTKEDLAFAGREEGLKRLVADITERPPGASVLDVFRAFTTTVIDDLVVPGDEALLTAAKIIRGSRTLQERLTAGWESGAAAVTAAIAKTSSPTDDDDLVPAIVARTLWFTHRSIFLVALHGLLAEEDREPLAARLRVAADRAYDQLAGGLRITATDAGPLY